VQVFRELFPLGKGGSKALALDAGLRRSGGLIAERVSGSRVLSQMKRYVVNGEAWFTISLID
jgi:hypothetical protein